LVCFKILAVKLRLKLRPHHLLCAANFVGEGYSSEFIENFKNVLQRLNAGEMIEINNGTDAICAACPNKQNDQCQNQIKVELLDKKHSNLLGVSEGDKVTWQEAQQLIKNKITTANLQQLCAGCEWVIICQNKMVSQFEKF
jgi:uncharacterized protein